MVCCSAPFCEREEGPGVRFFPFPSLYKDKKLLDIWKERLLVNSFRHNRTYQVCHRHFSDDQYYTTAQGMVRLYPNAVPDLHILPPDTQMVCRFCLEKPEHDYQLIFPAWPRANSPTAEEIQQMLGIRVSPNDHLPQLICVTCSTKINYIKRIRTQFQKNDLLLRDSIEPPPPPPTPAATVEYVQPSTTGTGNEPPMTFVIEDISHVEEVVADSSGQYPTTYPEVPYLHNGKSTQDHTKATEQLEDVKAEPLPNLEIKKEPKEELDSLQLYDAAEYITDAPQDTEQIKMEPHGEDFGHLRSDEDSDQDQTHATEGGTPAKKSRAGEPFRYEEHRPGRRMRSNK